MVFVRSLLFSITLTTLQMASSLSSTVILAVGSRNPVKVKASVDGIRQALQLPIDDTSIIAEGFDVPSGVPDQPIGSEETKRGATNRALKAWAEYQSKHNCPPTYSIGLEGGIDDSGGAMECSAWMVIYNGSKFGYAKTASFIIPPAMAELVRGGMELGTADDTVFRTINSKQGSGTVGHLTRGVVDRTQYYSSAVLLAMIPFLWPDLYP